jgi:hypothetical protein
MKNILIVSSLLLVLLLTSCSTAAKTDNKEVNEIKVSSVIVEDKLSQTKWELKGESAEELFFMFENLTKGSGILNVAINSFNLSITFTYTDNTKVHYIANIKSIEQENAMVLKRANHQSEAYYLLYQKEIRKILGFINSRYDKMQRY